LFSSTAARFAKKARSTMPPSLYLHGAGIVLCTAIAFFSLDASARNASRCLTFHHYDSYSGTVGIANSCGQCRRTTIYWCDGTSRPVQVLASSSYRVPGFAGCTMKKFEDFPCEAPVHTQTRTERRIRVVKTEDRPAIASSIPIKPPIETKNNRGTSPRTLAAIPSPKVDSPAPPKIDKRTKTQLALFPEASEYDWNTLLCTVNGQSLISQAEALLTRKAVLREMVDRISSGPEAVGKLDEVDGANKELKAIDRELGRFRERAKEILQDREVN
jgi:hypothetical protein